MNRKPYEKLCHLTSMKTHYQLENPEAKQEIIWKRGKHEYKISSIDTLEWPRKGCSQSLCPGRNQVGNQPCSFFVLFVRYQSYNILRWFVCWHLVLQTERRWIGRRMDWVERYGYSLETHLWNGR